MDLGRDGGCRAGPPRAARGGRLTARHLRCTVTLAPGLGLRAGAFLSPALEGASGRAAALRRAGGNPGRLAAFRRRLVSQLQEQARAQTHTPPASPAPQPAQDRLPSSPVYEVGVAVQSARVSDSPGTPSPAQCPQGQRASPCCSAWHLSRAGGPGRSPQCQGTRRTSSVPASAAPGWASGVRSPFLARPAGPRRGLLVPVSISLILLLGPDYTPPWNPPFGLSRHSLSGTPCCTGPSQLSRPSAPVGHCVVLRLPLAFLLTPVGIAS